MSNTNKQLQDIKDLHNTFPDEGQEIAVMRKLAKEVVKYTLEQAAEKAELDTVNMGASEFQTVVDKQSILSLESQIIKDLGL